MQEISINTGSVVRAALALALLYAVYLLRDLVLVILTAVVIASSIEPAARRLGRRRIPRLPAVLLIYLTVAAILFGVFYFLVPPLLSDTSTFLRTVPEYLESVDFLEQFSETEPIDPSQSDQLITSLAERVQIGQVVDTLSVYLTRIPGGTLNAISSIFGGAFSFALIVVISFYLSVQEKGIESFLNIVVPSKHKAYAVDLWRRAQNKIGRWMQGQLLLVLIIGLLVYLGLTILGVKHALLFAILAGLFELIPLFGPVLASIPAILMAFVDGGLTLGLIVAGVYIIIQQFENHLIYPLVVHKVVGVPALVVILALIIGGQLAGFLGIILAVPLATALMELTSDLEKRAKLKATAE